MKDRIRNLPATRPPVEKEPPPWRDVLSTPRARLSKRRKRQGLHYTAVLLSEEHLDGLIYLNWLTREERANRAAIQKALDRYLYLYASLVERYAHMLWARMAREERQAGRRPTPLSPEPGA